MTSPTIRPRPTGLGNVSPRSVPRRQYKLPAPDAKSQSPCSDCALLAWSAVIPAALVGLSRAFDIDLGKYLSPFGKEVTGRGLGSVP